MNKTKNTRIIIIALATLAICVIAILLLKKDDDIYFHVMKKNANIHALSFWYTMGNPVKELRVFRNVISILKNRNGDYPRYEQINRQVAFQNKPNCMFYSYNKGGYQIAIWSGETIWIYNSTNNSYYEFDRDVASFSWYEVDTNVFYNETDAKAQYGLRYSIHPTD